MSAKLNITLLDFLSSQLNSQLNKIRENIPGIHTGNSSGCLHDFRVACRRSRAALNHYKTACDTDCLYQLKLHYKSLSKKTNTLRDLDVFIENFEKYKILLPVFMQSELKCYVEKLKIQQADEKQRVCSWLESNEFYQTIEFLTRNIQIDCIKPGPDALADHILFSHNRIFKFYGKLSKKYSSESLSESQLHTFRIRCKKLRYLIEFTNKKMDSKSYRLLLRQMKNIQDALGEINDLHVQIQLIQNEICDSPNLKPLAAAMLGGLHVVLVKKKQKALKGFKTVYKEFSSEKTENLLHKTFRAEH